MPSSSPSVSQTSRLGAHPGLWFSRLSSVFLGLMRCLDTEGAGDVVVSQAGEVPALPELTSSKGKGYAEVVTLSHVIEAFSVIPPPFLHSLPTPPPISLLQQDGALSMAAEIPSSGPHLISSGVHSPWYCLFYAALLYSCCFIPSSRIKSSVHSLNHLP
ncbi:unnamed protein product [Rangifer tarandus platyrhynchus]|uniref:Uncharacterized protein n=1 Tax=Rangifer tarandus platyrhynchus TaxID=3082113 RepID=A0ACB1MJR3_RANTA